MPKTFRGVVFHGVQDVRVEDRPFPETLLDGDAIVKVTKSGICESITH
jgi:threonine dehydrogenase-like Zn-dependent dehydrogenase